VAIDGPGPSLSAWIGDRTAAELVAVALGIAAVVLGVLAVTFWRKSRTLARDLASAQERLSSLPRGLPVGTMAPEFTVHSARSGLPVTLEDLRAPGLPAVLIFVSPGCGPCQEIFADVGRWQVALAEDVTVAVISEGDRADNIASLQNGSGDVLVQDEWDVVKAYKVRNTPTAVAITADGRIASALVSGAGIESLVRLTVRQQRMRASGATVPRQPVA
jgi:hypothetical protein